MRNVSQKTPFISAASVFGEGFGLGSVSGTAGAGAFLDMHGSALPALDGELREAQERAIAEQIREVEELARQQVELEMNPMLSSW
jgi:hypothetical protein